MTKHLIFLSMPGLRPGDVSESRTPTLYRWAQQGAAAALVPSFPCVTSPVQATMLTGKPPGEHGVIANGFYYRDRREVEFWVARNGIIQGEQTWDVLNDKKPDMVSAAWHTQNIKDAGADYIITPSPIHEDDGTTKLWCYAKPEGMYEELIEAFGHFPLQHYWGPLAGIQSTQWTFKAAAWLHERKAPNFHWVYVPHLDYAAQKFGPDSDEAKNALTELEPELAAFEKAIRALPGGEDVVFLAASEYAMTDVSQVVYPNRMLREAGLLVTRSEDGAEHLDIPACMAFAMVDHQFAHVYVHDPAMVADCARFFTGSPGIAGVYVGDDRKKIGMAHERAGEIVLVADPDHWFAYYWWLDQKHAPPFARTVDIHRKPGYDPVEMFVDAKTRSISLDARLVKGSHGAPVTDPSQHAALICSAPSKAVESGATYRDTDIQRMCLQLLGVET